MDTFGASLVRTLLSDVERLTPSADELERLVNARGKIHAQVAHLHVSIGGTAQEPVARAWACDGGDRAENHTAHTRLARAVAMEATLAHLGRLDAHLRSTVPVLWANGFALSKLIQHAGPDVYQMRMPLDVTTARGSADSLADFCGELFHLLSTLGPGTRTFVLSGNLSRPQTLKAACPDDAIMLYLALSNVGRRGAVRIRMPQSLQEKHDLDGMDGRLAPFADRIAGLVL